MPQGCEAGAAGGARHAGIPGQGDAAEAAGSAAAGGRAICGRRLPHQPGARCAGGGGPRRAAGCARSSAAVLLGQAPQQRQVQAVQELCVCTRELHVPLLDLGSRTTKPYHRHARVAQLHTADRSTSRLTPPPARTVHSPPPPQTPCHGSHALHARRPRSRTFWGWRWTWATLRWMMQRWRRRCCRCACSGSPLLLVCRVGEAAWEIRARAQSAGRGRRVQRAAAARSARSIDAVRSA